MKKLMMKFGNVLCGIGTGDSIDECECDMWAFVVSRTYS